MKKVKTQLVGAVVQNTQLSPPVLIVANNLIMCLLIVIARKTRCGIVNCPSNVFRLNSACVKQCALNVLFFR